MQIYSFQIDIRDLNAKTIADVRDKLQKLAPELKIRDPVLRDKEEHL